MIAIVLVLFLVWTRPRFQLLAAAIIGAIVLTYPVLRGSDLAPVDAVFTLAENVSEERASSFRVRLDNEEILLDRAMERPLFGWGGHGRSRVVNEYGRDITISDGYWVIAIGVGGWSRYLGEFGLLAAPLLLLAWRARRLEAGPETAVLAIIMAASLIDLIPNATLTPVTWLVAGALWGRLEVRAAETEPPAPDSRRRKLAYTRFPSGEPGTVVMQSRS